MFLLRGAVGALVCLWATTAIADDRPEPETAGAGAPAPAPLQALPPGWGDPGEAYPEAYLEEDEEPPGEPSDPRLPSGVTLTALGATMIGGGIATFNDTDAYDVGRSAALGSIVGGTVALASGATFLTYAGIEGSDTPRRSYGQVATGQILTGMGFATTTWFSITLLHGYYEGNTPSLPFFIAHAPAGGMMVTGASFWLAGARDVELEHGRPTRTVTRSPTMAVMGGAMVATGLAGCAASVRVFTADEPGMFVAQPVIAMTLAASGATTTSFGAALLVFGLTDAEIPRQLPAFSVGPTSVAMSASLD